MNYHAPQAIRARAYFIGRHASPPPPPRPACTIKLRFVTALEDSPEGLTTGKQYLVVPDPESEKIGLIRIVDDEAQTRLWSVEMFNGDISPTWALGRKRRRGVV